MNSFFRLTWNFHDLWQYFRITLKAIQYSTCTYIPAIPQWTPDRSTPSGTIAKPRSVTAGPIVNGPMNCNRGPIDPVKPTIT